MDHESRTLRGALWAALIACIAMAAVTHIRGVGAEDDCAVDTWRVERLPVAGLVCIWEPQGEAR
jgi:hypothetical protein